MPTDLGILCKRVCICLFIRITVLLWCHYIAIAFLSCNHSTITDALGNHCWCWVSLVGHIGSSAASRLSGKICPHWKQLCIRLGKQKGLLRPGFFGHEYGHEVCSFFRFLCYNLPTVSFPSWSWGISGSFLVCETTIDMRLSGALIPCRTFLCLIVVASLSSHWFLCRAMLLSVSKTQSHTERRNASFSSCIRFVVCEPVMFSWTNPKSLVYHIMYYSNDIYVNSQLRWVAAFGYDLIHKIIQRSTYFRGKSSLVRIFLIFIFEQFPCTYFLTNIAFSLFCKKKENLHFFFQPSSTLSVLSSSQAQHLALELVNGCWSFLGY